MQCSTLGKICRYLDQESCENVAHGFITLQHDMNNSLLAGLPRTLVAKLQICENIAAGVITRTPATDHITPILMNLQ